MSSVIRGSRWKLEPGLVPKPLWGVSAYRLLGRGAKWKAIRLAALDQAHDRCSVCGAQPEKLTCHEQWQYDDSRGIATLTGFEINCSDCDAATHMGRSSQHGLEDVAIDQLCRVNGCTPAHARALFARAIKVWRKRNSTEWTVAVDDSLLRKYPALSILQRSK